MTEEPRPGLPPDPPGTADEDEPPPKASAVRFFVLPLLVVAFAVGIFLVFNLMTFDRRSPSEYLQEVRGGGPNRRWQAAFELSRSINRVKPGPEREALAAETLRVYGGLSRNRPEDVPVRRYLALVLGKLGDPAAVPALLASAKDPDSETRLYSIWSLGMLADPRSLDAVLEASQASDPGERKMAAYVLGRLRSAAAIPRLKVLAEDSVADVRWNAAIALAELGDANGLPVLRSMLDREELARIRVGGDQAEAAMVNALKAVALLRDPGTLPLVEKIEREDPNLRVRDAARAAAEAIRKAGAAPPKASSNDVERRGAVLVG